MMFFLFPGWCSGKPSPLMKTSGNASLRLHSSSSVFCTLNCSGRWGREHKSWHLITKPFFVLKGHDKVMFFVVVEICFCRLDIHVSLFSFWRSMNNCVRSVSFQLLNDYLNPSVIRDRLEVEPPFVLGPKPP